MERHPTQSLPTSSDIWEFLKAILRTGHWRKTLRRGWCSSPVSSKSLDRWPSHWTFRISKKAMTKRVNLSNVGLMHRKTAPISGCHWCFAIFLVQKVGKNGWAGMSISYLRQLCYQFLWRVGANTLLVYDECDTVDASEIMLTSW